MAKVVIGDLQRPKSRGSLTVRRIRNEAGELKTIPTVDLSRETFGEDLRRVFARNVTRARRENRKAFGSSDLVPAKR